MAKALPSNPALAMKTFLAASICAGTGGGAGGGSLSPARSGSEANATLKAVQQILRPAIDEIRMIVIILSSCEARERRN
jgi:hypothetical protein